MQHHHRPDEGCKARHLHHHARPGLRGRRPDPLRRSPDAGHLREWPRQREGARPLRRRAGREHDRDHPDTAHHHGGGHHGQDRGAGQGGQDQRDQRYAGRDRSERSQAHPRPQARRGRRQADGQALQDHPAGRQLQLQLQHPCLGPAPGHGGAGNFAGLAIGLTLVLVHIVCIPITGTSVNPVRSIGPALFEGGKALSQLWLFIIAPFVGAALSAAVWKFLSSRD